MNFFNSNDDSLGIFYFPFTTTGVSDTTTVEIYVTGSIITPDKNWMPYRHFEYEPLWHKKYASIKYQMETMWD